MWKLIWGKNWSKIKKKEVSRINLPSSRMGWNSGVSSVDFGRVVVVGFGSL